MVAAGCGSSHPNDVAAIRAAITGSPATYLHYGKKTWGTTPHVQVRIRRTGDRAAASLSAQGAVPERVVLRRGSGEWRITSVTGRVINAPTASRPASAGDRNAIWAVERSQILDGHDSCVRHVVVTVSTFDPRYATISYAFHKPYGDCALHNGQDIYTHREPGWRILQEGDGFCCDAAPAGVVRSLFGACWVGIRG